MMAELSLVREVEQALAELPVLDVHTHLVGGKLAARGLQDILLYHMMVSDLYAAGCPSGKRLTEYPGWPSREEASLRIEEALPYLPKIKNTSMSWVLRTILKDLYGWHELPDQGNWRSLDGLIRERADDQAWQYGVLDRAGILRSGSEWARRGAGQDDARLEYALEWGFFTRSQWGEYDTALYELERCWGKAIESPIPIGSGARPATLHTIRSVEDVLAAVQYYVDTIPYDHLLAVTTHISTDIDFRMVSEAEMAAALARRGQAGPVERDIYASFVNEAYLTALHQHAGEIVFQFSFGAEPLPFETASRLSQRTVAQVAEMIARHPQLRFQCFLASLQHNQALCTLARELPNFSLAGYWWHNFFPTAVSQLISERLDMLPVNKQIGFFSDAYCVEWSYGKIILVRRLLAQALAERIARGQYSLGDAVAIAREILFESPQSLLGMSPKKAG